MHLSLSAFPTMHAGVRINWRRRRPCGVPAGVVFREEPIKNSQQGARECRVCRVRRTGQLARRAAPLAAHGTSDAAWRRAAGGQGRHDTARFFIYPGLSLTLSSSRVLSHVACICCMLLQTIKTHFALCAAVAMPEHRTFRSADFTDAELFLSLLYLYTHVPLLKYKMNLFVHIVSLFRRWTQFSVFPRQFQKDPFPVFRPCCYPISSRKLYIKKRPNIYNSKQVTLD